MREHIKVTVEKDGKLTLEVQGVHGPQCISLTEFLEREIGDVLEREKTGDFYKANQSVRLRNTVVHEDISA